MPLIFGEPRKEDANYLDSCRMKRNTVEYDYVSEASEDDAKEILEFPVIVSVCTIKPN